MHLEIQVALNFIISYLYNKLPRRRVNVFGEELERQLKQRYEGHWYPDKPYKGSGFRCIHIGKKVDPMLELAAMESGLDINDVCSNLPRDLSVWIDPFEVSYQIGEKGPVKMLFMDDGKDNGEEQDKEMKSSFNPDAQVFMPVREPCGLGTPCGSPSPPSIVSPSIVLHVSQPLTFTSAAFAATKFGSTKMKSGGRSSGKASQASPAGLVSKQRGPTVTCQPLYGLSLGLGQLPKHSALSPNAKEFVLPSASGQRSLQAAFLSDGALGLAPLPYSTPFDMFTAYGGLNDQKSLVDGLNLILSNMQFSNQQVQPVMAN